MSTNLQKSPAKALHEQCSTLPDFYKEQRLAVILRNQSGHEYHVELLRSVVEQILDPDVPDVFIEVPCNITGTKRFLSTAFISEIDVREA